MVPVAPAGQLRTNKLAIATTLIFFSCAFGHGLHAVVAYQTVVRVPITHRTASMAATGWPWASAVWDVLTAAVGVYC